MESRDREILWRQFGAAIDMLGSAMRDCPDELWQAGLWDDPEVGTKFSAFWYVSYHCLFWLDLYLDGAVEGFMPPEPFSLEELDADGLLPPEVYTKERLLGYLAHCRAKCRAAIDTLGGEQGYRLCRFPWGEVPYAELLLDNLRHVQEHGAQLRMFLGQSAGKTARWIAKI